MLTGTHKPSTRRLMLLFEQPLSAGENSGVHFFFKSHKTTIFRSDGQNCEVGNIQILICVGKFTYLAHPNRRHILRRHQRGKKASAFQGVLVRWQASALVSDGTVRGLGGRRERGSPTGTLRDTAGLGAIKQHSIKRVNIFCWLERLALNL